jgi:ionotropic kainate glutamate receptor 2
MSPQEWDNPYPCIEEPEVLLNQFTLKNAIWFSVGAVLQQGSEIAPK